jgi:hypothetical protein
MIAFLTKDLMFQSRVASQAKAAQVACVAASSLERLQARLPDPAQVRLWIIDLSLGLEGLAEAVVTMRRLAPHGRIVAYGPHVQTDRLAQAAAAGVDEVLTRGQFDQRWMQQLDAARATDASDGPGKADGFS